jgi:hypothetical protein
LKLSLILLEEEPTDSSPVNYSCSMRYSWGVLCHLATLVGVEEDIVNVEGRGDERLLVGGGTDGAGEERLLTAQRHSPMGGGQVDLDLVILERDEGQKVLGRTRTGGDV